MRLSFTQFFQTGINTINAQQADLMHLYQQVGSGQRMVTPADDPLAAAQTINIAQAQAASQRYADNRHVLKTNLGAESNALDAAVNLIRDVKTRLVEVGNGTLSDADRESLATVLENMRETLMGIANTQDGNGLYVFAGNKASQPAFDETGTYHGSLDGRKIQADATRQIDASDLGWNVFERAPQGSRAYVTTVLETNKGSARISSPQRLDDSHDWAGGNFYVHFEADGAGGLQYVISGQDGKGNAIASQPPIPFDPDSGSLDIMDEHGTKVLRVAFEGQPEAGDGFTAQAGNAPDTQQNIFRTLDDLTGTLRQPIDGGDAVAQARLGNALNTAMQKISLNYDQVLSVRATVGTRLNEIDVLDEAGQQRNLGYENRLGQLENVDYYTAISQLQLRKMALETAAAAFKQIQSVSLFNLGH